MSVSINGTGSITGLSVGGLPDGSVDADSIAAGAVTDAKIGTGAVTNAKLGTGIDAAKLADGSVTSTELQHISTLSSNAQTQLAGAGGLKEYSRGAKNGAITISSTTPIDVGIRANLNPTSTSDIIRIQHFWGSADSTAGTAQFHALWKSLNGGTYTEHLKWGNYINHWVFASSTFRSTSSLWWTGTAGDLGWSTGVLSVGVKIALQSSNTWIYNEGFGFTANEAAKQMSFIEAFRYSSSVYTAGTDA